MMIGSNEVYLFCSGIQGAVSRLRGMATPLFLLRPEDLDAVGIYFSAERDALLLRLGLASTSLSPRMRTELMPDLEMRGFEVLESADIAPAERSRFEQLLQQQYELRLHKSRSENARPLVAQILDALEERLHTQDKLKARAVKAQASSSPPSRPETNADLDGLISELSYMETRTEKSQPDTLPLRMETFGPLDDMIAKLPRASTEELLDTFLDNLWP